MNGQMGHLSELWEWCFLLPFLKGWSSVHYAKGTNKGRIYPPSLIIWRIGTALIMAITQILQVPSEFLFYDGGTYTYTTTPEK